MEQRVPKARPRGITVIEFLIVTAVTLVVAVAIATSFSQVRRTSQAITHAQNIAAVLNEARSNTISTRNNTQWGAHFVTASYTLFRGATYDPLATTNVTHTLPQGVTISSIALQGGGADVVFNRINGGTSQSGSITVDSGGQSRVVNILASGEASVSRVLPPQLLTRLVDTRHVDFTLPWSIHAATTLTLIFYDPPNPPTTQNIAMAPFFSGGNSVFNWSGAYTVGGAAQTLKIHTHLIDPPGARTILSVHRDKMENTKALDILIDAQAVASYAADGAVTPAIGVTAAVQ